MYYRNTYIVEITISCVKQVKCDGGMQNWESLTLFFHLAGVDTG